MEMLKRIPEQTRKKLSRKGYFPQDGYILQYLPVPPNCLSVPEISDGVTVMSSVSQIISKSLQFTSFFSSSF
jgi:DNA-directed RNA polymerase-5 subunit 1